MTHSHPTTEVTCKKCNKKWLKRKDGLKTWTGYCHSCSSHNKMLGNSFTKGHKLSEEHKRKVGEGLKGKMSGNKHPMFGKHHSEESNKKRSKTLKEGMTLERRHKMSINRKGKKQSIEDRKKKSEAQKGEKGSNWQGGKTHINQTIRHSIEYRLWRTAIFERDNYTCIWCGDKSTKGHAVILNADHIKEFALYPELRFAIDNGRTLCIDCHRKTETYGVKININNINK